MGTNSSAGRAGSKVEVDRKVALVLPALLLLANALNPGVWGRAPAAKPPTNSSEEPKKFWPMRDGRPPVLMSGYWGGEETVA